MYYLGTGYEMYMGRHSLHFQPFPKYKRYGKFEKPNLIPEYRGCFSVGA
jgi:hypothetical protein